MDILLLIRGLLLILVGANYLTDGATSVAKRFHIPSVVIGLTIVAFGTSVPGLTVSVSSALKDDAGVAVGNIVGSSIFSTLMIASCTVLFVPIVITRNALRKKIPLRILSSIVLLIYANDVFLDKAPRNTLDISDGLILLCFSIIFLGYTFAMTSRNTGDAQLPKGEIRSLPMWKSVLLILGGLGGLIFGGQQFVEGTSNITRSLGASESIIGPTFAAGGTSLPRLATSIVAALKENPEIAIDNAIGSNLFSIFFVLGCSASITPLQLASINSFDLFTLIGSDVLLQLFGLFFVKRAITRIGGNILVLCYITYTIYLIYQI